MNDVGPLLSQAAPWIAQFSGSTMIVKFGGELLTSASRRQRLADQVAILQQCGIRPVIVHGAGKQVDEACAAKRISIQKVNGRRITDEATLGVVVETLSGLNAQLVEAFAARGVAARGMSQVRDSWPVKATRRPPVAQPDGSTVDFGLVGDVASVAIPEGEGCVVLPCLGHDGSTWLNINADTLARSAGVALGAEKILFLTGVSGVMRSLDDAGPISQIPASQLKDLIQSEGVTGGMKAKLEECLKAIEQGIPQVHVISGREPHTLLREVFTDEGCGTLIVP